MMPPRHRRRSRYCADETCSLLIGKVHRAISGGTRLDLSVHVTDAKKTGERTWRLTCCEGHETEWAGDGINWWEVPQAA